MVEHQGIAPCIPVWKTGVYLSTPMLEKMESRVRVALTCDGFADHCLGCSANGTLKWRMGNARCRMQVLTAVCSAENNCVDDDGPYRRGSVPSAVPIILATVVRTFSG